MSLQPESLATTDAASVVASEPAIASESLDQNWACDIDGARLHVTGRHVVGTTTYEIRECSANPGHVKHQPI